MKSSVEIVLPSEISDSRLDTLLKLLHLIQSPDKNRTIRLNWTRVTEISPAGHAVLACVFDAAVEADRKLESVFIKKKWRETLSVQNLSRVAEFSRLPKPTLHDVLGDDFVLASGETALNICFMENVKTKYREVLSEDLAYSCQLICNELMQNSVDHSTSERYYLYAGRSEKWFHIGILDRGITIPAKLEQKYPGLNDVEYLSLACREGISTRRQRQGGLGLNHTFDLLKDSRGTLVLLSRDAQVRRYFRNQSILRGALKYRLNGTWCFARFPLSEDES